MKLTQDNYVYQPVDGAAVFHGVLGTMREAKRRVRALRSMNNPEAEIERILLLPHGAKRYWRWRNGRWSLDWNSDPLPKDLSRWD